MEILPYSLELETDLRSFDNFRLACLRSELKYLVSLCFYLLVNRTVFSDSVSIYRAFYKFRRPSTANFWFLEFSLFSYTGIKSYRIFLLFISITWFQILFFNILLSLPFMICYSSPSAKSSFMLDDRIYSISYISFKKFCFILVKTWILWIFYLFCLFLRLIAF